MAKFSSLPCYQLHKIKRFKYTALKGILKEVIHLVTPLAYKITGLVILVVGALFFLRDLGVNFIGNTSGWTILIVLVGSGLLAGDFHFNSFNETAKPRKR